jgi:hypothetical protein
MALGVREIVRRFGYHPAKPSTVTVYEDLRHRYIELALHLDEVLADSREKVEAFTDLQKSLQSAIAVVACRMTPDDELPLPHDLPPGDLLG